MDIVQTPGSPQDPMIRIIEMLTTQVAEQNELIKKLQAQIAWFQRQMYGKKSEKHMDVDNSPNLFSEAGGKGARD